MLVSIMTVTMALVPTVQASDITVKVNGEEIHPEMAPVIVEERTLVPLRAVSEALGCDVSWDADTKGITLCDGNNLYFTWIDKDHAFKTSATALEDTTVMDVSPTIMNDYTMVPLRAISEMFGATVNWDGGASTVTIDYTKKNVEEGLAKKFETYEKVLNSDNSLETQKQVLNQKYDAYKGYADGTGNVVNAEIQLEDGGNIELELYPDIAPKTVANFVKLANEKFYNGLVFHRVIKDFMIQGGGYDTDMTQHETDTITGEFLQNGSFNMIPHERGVISMARTAMSMDSASSQFFIMHRDSPSLNGQYAAFGKVTSGMEYVDKIAETETHSLTDMGMDDVPVQTQIIKTIIIK